MKLQMAVDLADTRGILEIASETEDIIDIFEIGTPVIMREGMRPVRELKEKYPKLRVLADSKIVDGGRIEAKDICESGADILTVLAFADDITIREVVETAGEYGCEVMADLIGIKDIAARAGELLQLGVTYVGVHTGVDMQKMGRTPLSDLRELMKAVPRNCTAVAGGVSMKTIREYAAEGPEIIIAGSALYGADNIRKAVLEMKGAMKE